jgi:hypothetical protein
MPSTGWRALFPYIVVLGCEAFLFFVIIHNWWGYRLSVKTSTPFRRIFNELVYINSAILLLGHIVFIFSAIAFTALLAGLRALPEPSGFEHWPNSVSYSILALVGVICLLTLIGPVLCVQFYYYGTLLTNLFKISRRRAILLTFIVVPIAALPVTTYDLWDTYLIPLQLSNPEREAVLTLQSIGSLLSDYSSTFHKELSIAEMKTLVNVPTDKRNFWMLMHSSEISRIVTLDASVESGGYRFYVNPGRLGGYINAVPVRCGGDTRYSFVGDVGGARLFAAERNGAPALFSDRALIFMGQ